MTYGEKLQFPVSSEQAIAEAVDSLLGNRL